METKEWTTKDKSKWGFGQWMDEPDKMQWQDEATGLPCLMVRNNGGAWCGYVGLSEGHPFYGKEYSTRIPLPAGFSERKMDDRTPVIAMFCEAGKDDGLVSLELAIEVHGGLTFSDFCGDHDEAAWERFKVRASKWPAEAECYPVGDAARMLQEWAGAVEDFAVWKARAEATGICHIPAPGEPERVWWLGFDCAHSGDSSPGYDNKYGHDYGAYRSVAYVKREVESLAKQLAELTA